MAGHRPWIADLRRPTARAPAATARPRATMAAATGARGARLRRGFEDAVAHAVDRLHEARSRGVRFELAPDVLDVRIDRALVALERDAMDGVEQLRTGEHAPRLTGHRHEELELGGG